MHVRHFHCLTVLFKVLFSNPVTIFICSPSFCSFSWRSLSRGFALLITIWSNLVQFIASISPFIISFTISDAILHIVYPPFKIITSWWLTNSSSLPFLSILTQASASPPWLSDTQEDGVPLLWPLSVELQIFRTLIYYTLLCGSITSIWLNISPSCQMPIEHVHERLPERAKLPIKLIHWSK